ncbi:MFS general substrate transporter [Saccharata proteae CBS 121410]|uniref:MFS general substrate transporter n=1 Tax=Saccharata proteae CBS 121410 TaxID=1314787 RepID=A0A9P4I0G0_9PEZI|nr:MFS general substrate transporter [Saccharata proteae CBS 121410]
MPEHKLPIQQFVILSICRFAEPIALTSAFPYLPEMIESFGVPKNEIAKWAGAASAIFSLGQCLTSIAWGRASDRYGRKTIILLGLFNTMLMSLLWGFSTSLPMALTVRALQGAGNGNVGILRTVVAELCPWKELQPRGEHECCNSSNTDFHIAFSIMPLVYNIGSIFGPAIGGALSNPARVDVTKPRGNGFFEKFPYALPNLVIAAFFLLGISTGILFLHETLAARKDRRDYGLLLGNKINAATHKLATRIKNRWRSAKGEETEPLLKHSDSSSITAANEDEESGSMDVQKPGDEEALAPPGMSEVLTRQSALNLVVYAMLAMHSIGYDQLLPVFMHHPVQDPNDPEGPDVQLPFKFASGFGIGSGMTGLMFTMYGAVGMIYQLVLFPPIARRYGVLRCFRFCSIIFPLVYLVTPFTALLPTTASRQAFMFLIMMFKGCCSTFAFPSSTILLTNSAASLRILGTLNGIATSVSAVGRAAGPAVGGSTFTLGVEHGYVIAPFWILAAIALLGAIPAFFLVEGDGFGPDEDEEIDKDMDAAYSARNGVPADTDDDDAAAAAAKHSSPRPITHSAEDQDGEEDGYGPPGELLSRTTTFSSNAVSDDDNNDDDDARRPSPFQPSSSLPSERPHPSQRGLRRRTSVPVGMGVGFRRLSSNLGQSRSGYGTGQTWGG